MEPFMLLNSTVKGLSVATSLNLFKKGSMGRQCGSNCGDDNVIAITSGWGMASKREAHGWKTSRTTTEWITHWRNNLKKIFSPVRFTKLGQDQILILIQSLCWYNKMHCKLNNNNNKNNKTAFTYYAFVRMLILLTGEASISVLGQQKKQIRSAPTIFLALIWEFRQGREWG